MSRPFQTFEEWWATDTKRRANPRTWSYPERPVYTKYCRHGHVAVRPDGRWGYCHHCPIQPPTHDYECLTIRSLNTEEERAYRRNNAGYIPCTFEPGAQDCRPTPKEATES